MAQQRHLNLSWVKLDTLLVCSLFQSMLQNAAIAMGSLRDCKKSQICKCQRACGAKSACKFGSHPCWVVSFAQPHMYFMPWPHLHRQGRPWGSQISWRRSPFTAGQSPWRSRDKKGQHTHQQPVRSKVAGWSCVWKVDPNSFQLNAFGCFCWFRQHFCHDTKQVSLFRGFPNFCCLMALLPFSDFSSTLQQMQQWQYIASMWGSIHVAQIIHPVFLAHLRSPSPPSLSCCGIVRVPGVLYGKGVLIRHTPSSVSPDATVFWNLQKA